MEIEKKIKELIESELNKELILVDNVSYFKEDGNYYLRITIDKNGIVDIDTCVLATKIINPILDKADLIKESYILDVTSKERGDN